MRPLTIALMLGLGASAAARAADHRIFAAGDPEAPHPDPPAGTRLYVSEGGGLFVSADAPVGADATAVRAAAAPAWWMLIDNDVSRPFHIPMIPRRPLASPWLAPRRPHQGLRRAAHGRIDHPQRLEPGRPARFALDGTEGEVLIEVLRDVSTRTRGARSRTALQVQVGRQPVFDGLLPLLPAIRRVFTVGGTQRLLETVAEQRVVLPEGARALMLTGEPGSFVRVLAPLRGSPPAAHARVLHDDGFPLAPDESPDARHRRALSSLPSTAAMRHLSGNGYYRETTLQAANGASLQSRPALLRVPGPDIVLPHWLAADTLTEAGLSDAETLFWLPPASALELSETDGRDGPALYRIAVASAGPLPARASADIAASRRIALALRDDAGGSMSLVFDPILAARLTRRATADDGQLAYARQRAPSLPVIDVARIRLVYVDGLRPRALENRDALRGVWVRIERHRAAAAPLAQVDGTPGLQRLAATLRAGLRGEQPGEPAALAEDRDLQSAAVLIQARRSAFEAHRCATPDRPPTSAQAAAALALARRLGSDDPVLTRCALTQAVAADGDATPEAEAAFVDWASNQQRPDLVTGLRAAHAVRRDRPEDWRALADALAQEGEPQAAQWIARVAALAGETADAPAARVADDQGFPLTPHATAGRQSLTLDAHAAPVLRWRGTSAQPLHWRLPGPGRYRLELRSAGSTAAGDRLQWLRIETPGIAGGRADAALLPLIPTMELAPAAPAGRDAIGPVVLIDLKTDGVDVPLQVRPMPGSGEHLAVLAELRRLPETGNGSPAAVDRAESKGEPKDPQPALHHDPHGATMRWLQEDGVHRIRLPLRIDTLPALDASTAAPTAAASLERSPSLNFSADAPLLPLQDAAPPTTAHYPQDARDALIQALWLQHDGRADAVSAAGWALHRAAAQTLSPDLRALRDRLRAAYRWAPHRQLVTSGGQWLRPLADGQLRSPEFVARSALGGELPDDVIVLAPDREWRLSGFLPGETRTLELTLHAALPSARLQVATSPGQATSLVTASKHRLRVVADARGEVALRLSPAMPATYLRVRVDRGASLRTTDTEPYHLPPLRIWSPFPQWLLVTEWDGHRDATRQQWVASGETLLRSERLPAAALRVDALQPRAPVQAQAMPRAAKPAETSAAKPAETSAAQPVDTSAATGSAASPASPASPLVVQQRLSVPQSSDEGRQVAIENPWPRTPGAYVQLLQRRDPDADSTVGERFLETGARWRLASRDGRWHARLDAFGRRHTSGIDAIGGEALLEWRAPEAPWDAALQLRVLHQPGVRIDGRTPAAVRLRAAVGRELVLDDRWEFTATAGLVAHASTIDRISPRDAERIDSDVQSRYRLDHPVQPYLEQRLRWRADWRTAYTGTLGLVGNAPGDTRPDHLRLNLEWHRVGPRAVVNAGMDWRHAFADADRGRGFDRLRVEASATGYWLGPVHGWRLRLDTGYDLRARDATAGLRFEWFRHGGRGLQDLLRSELPLRGVLEHDLYPSLRKDGAP